MNKQLGATLFLAVTLGLAAACSDTQMASNQNTASSNANKQTSAPMTPGTTNQSGDMPKTTGGAPPMGGGGSPIDTSKYDADIKKSEEQYNKDKNNSAAKVALANAYLERATALTDARQYRSALGDYRRAIKLDPSNEDAKNGADTIIGIYKQMGREVPEEGKEPPPLPYNKESKQPTSAPY